MTENKPITEIFKLTQYGETQLGYIEENLIYSLSGRSSVECGRVEAVAVTDASNTNTSKDPAFRIFRKTAHDEQELGYVTMNGEIVSHGIFEGGSLGWLEEDGVVIQAGLILGEEEAGRVAGPQSKAGAAALLLHFLPADAEEEKRMRRM